MISKGRRIKTSFFSHPSPYTSFHGHYITARISYRVENEAAKVAVVLSKKIAKDAVTRNKIRRRLYTIMRDSIDKLPKGTYIVLYPKKEVLTASYSSLYTDLLQNIIEKQFLH